MAFPFYSLEQVITHIEAIYDDKFASDQVDESDGVAREELVRRSFVRACALSLCTVCVSSVSPHPSRSLEWCCSGRRLQPKFVCEFFLKTHGLRQSAEVALYRLLVSVKNTYRRHSHVKLFARFLHLLQARDHESSDSDSLAANDTVARKPERDEPAPSKRKRTGPLPMSFLYVFLTARYYLLRPPPPVTATLKGAKPSGVPVPHVIQVEPTTTWVALDHAITTLKWYISYLPDESVVRYCREVEYSTAIFAGGTVTEVAGNRLAVRAEMRRAMLASSTDGKSGVQDDESNERDAKWRPRIVANVHRVLLLLLDALEQRQAVMERDLVALFDAVRLDCSAAGCDVG